MKILLIGKNGQLGQALNSVLLEKKHTVASYSHSELDVENKRDLSKTVNFFKPNVVINASAYHLLSACEENPARAFAINAVAVKNLAEICKKRETILVHYSTDYVFDGISGKPYVEEDAPGPLQVYGISKYAGEIFALQYNPNSIVIRTCGVYGGKKGSREKSGNFILTILDQIKNKKILEVSSEQIVSPTYANHLAKATVLLLSKKPNRGIYHLVNEGHCSWAAFAEEIVRVGKGKAKIIPVDRSGVSGGARRPLFSALSNTKAKKMGVVLPSWKSGLLDYISFLGIK